MAAGSIEELSAYRFERAVEDLETAKMLCAEKQYRSSINRSYYSIFHAMRSVTALDGFDSSKHSGIIAYINRNYVKEGIFEKKLSKILDQAFRMREKADYQDFFIASREDAEKQISGAMEVIDMVGRYIRIRIQSNEE